MRKLPRELELELREKLYEIKRQRKKSQYGRFMVRIMNILARHVPGGHFRAQLHKIKGVIVGKNVWIGEEVYIDNEYPFYIFLEDGVEIAAYSMIMAHGRDLHLLKPGMYVSNLGYPPSPVQGRGRTQRHLIFHFTIITSGSLAATMVLIPETKSGVIKR